MLLPILQLAQGRNADINKWLGENPLVLGSIFLLIGGVILGWGIYELKQGVAHDKRGREVSGGQAKALAIVRVVAGGGCLLFGLFKIVAG